MSLAERLSSVEWREQSPSGLERRKLSFNPVEDWVPPVAREEPVGAFEVSKARRILQVTVAVIYCLVAAGTVFGYAALKPVLIAEGVYRDRCTPEEIDKDVRVCYEQELRLNFMFTVAAVSTNVCALPVGTILDRYGPRITGIVGCFFLAVGSVSLAFARDLPFDGYIPGYLFLALGGPFVFISSFQLSNTFPQYSGLILALLTGAFDTSSAVFLLYRLTYQSSNGTFQPKKFFLVYLIVPALILIVQVVIMPAQSYKTVGELVAQAETPIAGVDRDSHSASEDHEEALTRQESVVTEIASLLGTKDGADQSERDEAKKKSSGVWGALHGRSAWEQIRTPWFVLITLFTVVQMTRINYFVATIRPQYEYLTGDHEAAVRINTFFDVALPLGGVISVPFIGLVLDNTSTPFVLTLLVTIATAIGVLGVVPQMWAAYANICLFVIYRPFYYTAVSDYAAKVFGFHTFGKVYGLIICLAGLLNFSQSGLDALTHRVFKNDPMPVNVALLVLALFVGVSLAGYVWRKSGLIIQRDVLEREAEGASEVVVPGGEVFDEETQDDEEEEQRGRPRGVHAIDYGTIG